MKNRIQYGLFLISIALLAGGLSHWQTLLPLDRLLYDRIVDFHSLALPDDIVIAAIDEKSLQTLGRWPWSRQRHAELIKLLNSVGAKAVVLDILLTDADKEKSADDAQLAKAIADFGLVGLPMVIENINNNGQLVERLPLPEFSRASGIVGHVHVERDDDGICRSVFLQEGVDNPYWPHLSVSLLSALQNKATSFSGVSRPPSTASSGPMLVARDHYNLISFMGSGGTVPQVSYIDILEGEVSAEYLRDKIVFVGMTATGLGDSFTTPAGQMAGVELNTNIFQSLREQKFLKPIAKLTQTLSAMAISFILISYLSLLSPRWFLWGTVATIFTVLITTFLMLNFAGVWFAPGAIVASLLVFYPLWNWQRLERALAFLKAELTKTDTRPTLANQRSGKDSYSKALQFLSNIYPDLQWRIFSLVDNQVISSDGTSIRMRGVQEPTDETEVTRTSDYFYRKALVIDGEDCLVELQSKKEFSKNFESLLDRNLFASGQESRRYPSYGVEVVERTMLELESARRLSSQSRELARQSIRHLPEAMFVTDNFGQLQYANQQARDCFSITDVSSFNLFGLLTGLQTDDVIDINTLLLGLCETGKNFVFEGIDQLSDKYYVARGQRISLSGDNNASKVRAADFSVLVFFFTDITALKANEKARLDTLHFLSHDIRSPMTSVLALIETAKVSSDKIDENVLNQIEVYINRSLNYAQQFIQLAKAEDTRSDRFYTCNLLDIVDNAVDQIFPMAKRKNVAISVDSIDDVLSVLGDGDLLERMFNNLLSNAVKFSPNDSFITVNVTKGQANSVEVSIADQGPGIPEEEISILFERFKKGKSENPSGIGLGLYFVSIVCERHGGTIAVNSSLGQGSVFKVSLPLDNSPNPQPI